MLYINLGSKMPQIKWEKGKLKWSPCWQFFPKKSASEKGDIWRRGVYLTQEHS